ncbi:MAG: ABC transporter permease [Negativicutes bacterium]|nr:ABC transporter permease [Negativicutes bacterium]
MESVMEQALHFLHDKPDVLLAALGSQLYLVAVSSLLTTVIGVPLGVAIHRLPSLRQPVLKIAGTLYTIPILALFGLLIPVLGIGTFPALIALVIYGIMPVLYNTRTGLADIDPAIVEAAQGMGACSRQLLVKVELPLAFPKIIAGIRTSVVMNISVATFAVFIGGGGLGTIILQGIRTAHDGMLLCGTLLVALTAVGAERGLGWLQSRVARTVKGNSD